MTSPVDKKIQEKPVEREGSAIFRMGFVSAARFLASRSKKPASRNRSPMAKRDTRQDAASPDRVPITAISGVRERPSERKIQNRR